MDTTTILVIVSAAFAVSEALSLIPWIKANGIFQLVYSVLESLISWKLK